MAQGGVNGTYEVVLGPAAIRVILGLPRPDRGELAAALRVELGRCPNARHEVRFGSDVRPYADPGARWGGVVYTATPLSCAAYTAIHRPLTEAEMRRLWAERGRRTPGSGFYVLDILRAESAFIRRPRVA